MKFPVVLHKDADSEYAVIVPGVSGCYSAGHTVPQAFEKVKEVLSQHYEGLVVDGEPLPQVHEVDDHLDNPRLRRGCMGRGALQCHPAGTPAGAHRSDGQA